MVLYSIPVYECPDCIKQYCDGILFFDKDAVIVLHVSKSTSINLFEYNNDRIIVNPTQFDTHWGWDFTRVHVSNYQYVKNKFDITYVIFLTSNCLMLRNPSEFIKDYDAGFSEQQHGIVKLTPPLLIQDYQIGWGGSFLTDPRYLNILSELNSNNKYGCVIDGTFVKSFIMDKICYFYEKYFNYENNYFCLEEMLLPTIACNMTDKIADSLLYFRSVELPEFKLLFNKNDVFFNKRIPLDMSNDIRIYYNDLIYNNLKNIELKMEHFYTEIHGWFNFQDVYSKMVETASDGDHFVEVGVYKGKSTSFMGVEIYNSKKNIKFDAIDCFDVTPEFGNETFDIYENTKNSLKKLMDLGIINLIKDYSLNAVNNYEDESLTFCYIDSSHDYDSVKKDIIAWLPKIKEGGILAGHDYDLYHYEVYNAVNDVLGQENITVSETSFIYKKKSKYLNFFDAVYYINLDERTDRKILFENRAKELNIPVVRFSAIVPKEGEYIQGVGDQYDERRKYKVGCTLSHQAIAKKAKEMNFKNVLIFEDDCVFLDDFTEKAQLYVNDLKTIDWNLMYFGGDPNNSGIYVTDNLIRIYDGGVYQTHAYAMNNSFYEKILSENPNNSQTIDNIYINIQAIKIIGKELLAVQDNSFSDLWGHITNSEFVKDIWKKRVNDSIKK